VNSYQETLHRHLENYKASRLGVDQPGLFRHKGVDIEYGHILPVELKWLNLLEPFRAEIKAYLDAHPNVRPHRYFHHLNSSQAFAFNLFWPFFEAGASASLLRALQVNGSVSDWRLEDVPHSEEGTNVDVAWHDGEGGWTYCEVKLSEQGFGSAKRDQRHEEKRVSIYQPVLGPYCPAELMEPGRFFANYQILRNVWLVAREPSASLLFLMPRRNESLWGPLRSVLEVLPPDLAGRIHVAAVEDVLEALCRDESLPRRLGAYAELVAEKYVPS
jgi:hypothetical protein